MTPPCRAEHREVESPPASRPARRPLELALRALGLVVALALPACHHDGDQSSAAASAPPPVAAVAAPELHEDTYDLVLRPMGTYSAGKPGSAEIEVSAKGGYHCNDNYPYKFKVAESPGVTFAAPVFTKDALKLETGKATMKVDFTPASKGEKTLEGAFSFSLCSADRCLVEKRDLSLKIAVD